MELEEHADNPQKGDLNKQACSPYEGVGREFGLILGNRDDFLDEGGHLNAETEYECADYVEKEEHKELAVLKTHAIGNPGAVMVHVEDTPLAGRAVVASE